MENRESFFARLTKDRIKKKNAFKVQHGYVLSKYAHRHNFRKQIDPETNEPQRYFEHVRRTALILMDEVECYDADLINVALHHDTFEDTTAIDYEQMRQWIGPKIADRVLLLTKTDENKDTYTDDLKNKADWGTLVVKFCDRLDNLRTLENCDKDFILKQLVETRTKYYPLMDRLNAICPPDMIPRVRILLNNIKEIINKLSI